MLSKAALKSRANRSKHGTHIEEFKEQPSYAQAALTCSPMFGGPPMMRPSNLRSRIIDRSMTDSAPSTPNSSISISASDVDPLHLDEPTNITDPILTSPSSADSDSDDNIPHDFATCVLCNASLTQSEDDQIPFLHFFDLLCIVFDYLPLSQVFRMANICPKWKQILSMESSQHQTQTHKANVARATDALVDDTGIDSQGTIARYAWQAIEDTAMEVVEKGRNRNLAEVVHQPPYQHQPDGASGWVRATRPRFADTTDEKTNERQRPRSVMRHHGEHPPQRPIDFTILHSDTMSDSEEESEYYRVAMQDHAHVLNHISSTEEKSNHSDAENMRRLMWPPVRGTDDDPFSFGFSSSSSQLMHPYNPVPFLGAPLSTATPISRPLTVFQPSEQTSNFSSRSLGFDYFHPTSVSLPVPGNRQSPESLSYIPDTADDMSSHNSHSSLLSSSSSCSSSPTANSSWTGRSYLQRITSANLSMSPYARPPLSEHMIASLVNLERIHLYSPFNTGCLSTMENMQFLFRIEHVKMHEAELAEMWREHSEGANKVRKVPDSSRLDPATIDQAVIRALKNRRHELQAAGTQNQRHFDPVDHAPAPLTRFPRNPGLVAPPTGTRQRVDEYQANHFFPFDITLADANRARVHATTRGRIINRVTEPQDDDDDLLKLLAMHMHIRRNEMEHRTAVKAPVCSLLLPAASRLKTLIFTPDSLHVHDVLAISQLTSLTSLSLLPANESSDVAHLMLPSLRNLTALHVSGRNNFALGVIRALHSVPQLTTFAVHVPAELRVEDANRIVESLPNLRSLTISSTWPICSTVCDLLSRVRDLTHLELHVPWSTSLELPANLFDLTQLESLVLYGALATCRSGLPNSLKHLVKLRSLTVRGCFDSLTSMIDVLIGMPNINELDFTDSPLTSRCRERIRHRRSDIMLRSSQDLTTNGSSDGRTRFM